MVKKQAKTAPKKEKKPPKALSPQTIRELRSQTHHLKPVVIIGSQGLTDAVFLEIDRALNDHELIKVRAHIEDREELAKITDEICTRSAATNIQTIGHIIALYRKNLQ